MSTYGKNIADARLKKGWSQKDLAEKIGSSQQQIARYESGTEVRANVLIQLSQALDCTIAELLGIGPSVAIKAESCKSYPLPVFGRIAAGTPSEALTQSDATHETPAYLVSDHSNAFWLRISGNSMNRLFPDGSLVLIDPDEEVRNGDVGVVFVNGDDATIKRVYFELGSIRLHPESYDPEYADRVIDGSNPDAPDVRIIGKAVSYTAPDGWRA